MGIKITPPEDQDYWQLGTVAAGTVITQHNVTQMMMDMARVLQEQAVPGPRWVVLPTWITADRGKRTSRRWKKRIREKKQIIDPRRIKSEPTILLPEDLPIKLSHKARIR